MKRRLQPSNMPFRFRQRRHITKHDEECGGAHAVSARNAGSTYLFFDPDYGEFQFTDAVGYRRWLDILVRMSGYKSMFGSVDPDVWKRKQAPHSIAL